MIFFFNQPIPDKILLNFYRERTKGGATLVW